MKTEVRSRFCLGGCDRLYLAQGASAFRIQKGDRVSLFQNAIAFAVSVDAIACIFPKGDRLYLP
jgi:hypothetical protein